MSSNVIKDTPLVVSLTEDNFDSIMSDSKTLVIDFWASWCGPCQNFGPVFETVAAKHPDVKFAKVDVESQTLLAQDFNVRSVPFLVVIRENVALYAKAGALKESELIELIEDAKVIDMKEVHEKIQQHKHEHDHHSGHHEGCC